MKAKLVILLIMASLLSKQAKADPYANEGLMLVSHLGAAYIFNTLTYSLFKGPLGMGKVDALVFSTLTTFTASFIAESAIAGPYFKSRHTLYDMSGSMLHFGSAIQLNF